MSLTLPQPLSSSQLEELDSEKYVVVIANDNATKFACSKESLLRFSKLYRALSQASDVEELPLRCGAANAETTALVCMWLNHYSSSSNTSTSGESTGMPSRVSYPLQPGNSLSCFLNEWDSQFVEKILFAPASSLLLSSVSPSGHQQQQQQQSSPQANTNNRQKNSIVGNCSRVYSLAIAATFLQAQILVELCSGIFAFHIREAELESRPVQAASGESTVRSWFGLSGEFSAQERQLVLEQNRDLRDPQNILEKIKEMSDEAHDSAAACAGVAVGSGGASSSKQQEGDE